MMGMSKMVWRVVILTLAVGVSVKMWGFAQAKDFDPSGYDSDSDADIPITDGLIIPDAPNDGSADGPFNDPCITDCGKANCARSCGSGGEDDESVDEDGMCGSDEKCVLMGSCGQGLGFCINQCGSPYECENGEDCQYTNFCDPDTACTARFFCMGIEADFCNNGKGYCY